MVSPNRLTNRTFKETNVAAAAISSEQISEELQVIEENHNDKSSLERLRRVRAVKHAHEEVAKKKKKPTIINLENIYDQGFHICNLYYGKRRENESCMFCTEIQKED